MQNQQAEPFEHFIEHLKGPKQQNVYCIITPAFTFMIFNYIINLWVQTYDVMPHNWYIDE